MSGYGKARSYRALRLDDRPMLEQAEAPLAALLLVAPFYAAGLDSATGRAVAMLSHGAFLLFLLWHRRPSAQWWRHVRAPLLLALLALGWLIGGDAVAPDSRFAPDMGLPYGLGVVAGLAAFLSGSLIGMRRGPILRLIDWWLALALCALLIGGFLALNQEGGGAVQYWKQGRLLGLANNANILAAFSGAVALLALGRALSFARSRKEGKGGGGRVLLFGALSLMALLVQLATASRLPVILTLLLGGCIAIRGLLSGRARDHAMKLMIGIGLAVLILLSLFTSLLFERLGDLGGGALDRSMMWSLYARAVGESPWFGFGAGSFASVNAYVLPDPRMAQALWSVNSPHNIVLQLLIAGGWPYCLLLGAAAVAVAVPVFRYFRNRRSVEAVALLAVVVLLLGCAMVDIALDVPVTIALMLFCAGLLFGEAGAAHIIRVSQSKFPPA